MRVVRAFAADRQQAPLQGNVDGVGCDTRHLGEHNDAIIGLVDVGPRPENRTRPHPFRALDILPLHLLQLVCHGCDLRSEEHTSELQSLMRISYAVFCLKKNKNTKLPRAIYY